ncbi:MAG: flagellar hook-basal body complex protein FliE [Myxococcales bacterium]|nr:flagellar hook-basal body complex protein FliE [Myxococcales bacterium]
MVTGIGGIEAYTQVAGLSGVPASAAAVGPGFGPALREAIGAVEVQHTHADDALAMLASGESVDLHGTMIALEKADIALRTMVSVRDKFISAYEQVMNMSV